MNNLEITTEPTREEWEAVHVHEFNQTWEWGEVMSSIKGVTPIRLLAKIDGKPVGVLQGFEWKLGPISMAITSGESGGGGGPVVSNGLNAEVRLAVAKKLIEEMLRIRSLRTIIYASTDFGKSLSPIDKSAIATKWTPIVELLSDENKMLSERVEQKTRNQINKSFKNGIEVIEGTRDDLETYRSIQSELVKKKHLSSQHLNSLSSLQKAWDTLAPGKIKLFLAKLEEETVGGALIFYSGKEVYYKSGVLTDEGRNLYAGNALQWKIIQDAIKNGYKFYNMSGGTKDESDPLYGITKFKLSFGGELKPFRRYSASGNRALRFIVYRIRRLMGKNEWFPLVIYP